MKKIIVCWITLLTIATAYAQEVSVGPKIGLSRSTITAEGVEAVTSGDSSVGFHAGLFGRFTFVGFYVQPEVLFTSTRGSININDGTVNAVRKLNYNKVDVPVMFGAVIGNFLRFNLGPSFSLILNKDARSKGTTTQIVENYNKATIGYQLGIGLDINRLVFDLRYENSLSRLGTEVTVAGQSFETDLRNKLYILTVGYKLFQ